jgi:hypothetical protein
MSTCRRRRWRPSTPRRGRAHGEPGSRAAGHGRRARGPAGCLRPARRHPDDLQGRPSSPPAGRPAVPDPPPRPWRLDGSSDPPAAGRPAPRQGVAAAVLVRYRGPSPPGPGAAARQARRCRAAHHLDQAPPRRCGPGRRGGAAVRLEQQLDPPGQRAGPCTMGCWAGKPLDGLTEDDFAGITADWSMRHTCRPRPSSRRNSPMCGPSATTPRRVAGTPRSPATPASSPASRATSNA